MLKSDDWDITNGAVKIKNGKQSQFDKAVKEVHKKLVKEVKPEIFGFDKKKEHSNDVEYNITDTNGKWHINVYKKGDTNLSAKIFSEDQIIIKPEYYQTKKITYPEGGEAAEEKPKGPQLSAGWTIFLIILLGVLILVAVFWKKIWKWIRGERAQEKKVKEQLDIF